MCLKKASNKGQIYGDELLLNFQQTYTFYHVLICSCKLKRCSEIMDRLNKKNALLKETFLSIPIEAFCSPIRQQSPLLSTLDTLTQNWITYHREPILYIPLKAS